MSDFDYGNARLRALKSRLLSRQELDSLAGAESLNGLIAALIKTAYRKPIETALTRTSGLACISDSLHQDLQSALGRVHQFYDGQAGKMVALVLRRYDIHNLKGILRGLNRHAAADEILSTMIPVGELKVSMLTELVRSPDPRAAIDILAMICFFFAEPLLKLRIERPGAGTAEMELALDQWFYQETFSQLKNSRGDEKELFSALQIEADLVNLLTLLRFVHVPGEQKFLQEWLHVDQFEYLLVGPGRLSFALLNLAASQDTVETAVEILGETIYEVPLRAGLEKYANSALLSDIEKQLNRFRLTWMTNQIVKDPLGIGVLLGYFALKTYEVNNIRWIAQGINLGLQADAIRAELEYPP